MVLRRFAAEALGTALLLATVVGSGIMAERLSGGNNAIALLGNTLPTGAILVVLIHVFGPVSGAHFNPVVTAVMMARREISPSVAVGYVAAQVAGAWLGVLAAHGMFDVALLQVSTTVRSSPALWFAEAIATFGLLLTILGSIANRKTEQLPWLVGLYITAAYWFTASTSFANPAVTIARGFTDTFAGIAPAGIPGFIAAQVVGAAVAVVAVAAIFGSDGERSA